MGKPYRECPLCGAHLDAGEICDCKKPKQEHAAERRSMRDYKGVTPCALACMTQKKSI